jgi:hypothetical protein
MDFALDWQFCKAARETVSEDAGCCVVTHPDNAKTHIKTTAINIRIIWPPLRRNIIPHIYKIDKQDFRRYHLYTAFK